MSYYDDWVEPNAFFRGGNRLRPGFVSRGKRIIMARQETERKSKTLTLEKERQLHLSLTFESD